MQKLIIVGGGIAGIMAAVYAKKFYSDNLQVTVIYDHKVPNIGVGESLTPALFNFLDNVGITRDEIVKNVNGTIKLGLKFKNWLNDGNYYYHAFSSANVSEDKTGWRVLYDIANNTYDGDTMYSKILLDNSVVPENIYRNDTYFKFCSLHLDATLLSKFVENKFKSSFEILDDIVIDVVKEGSNIKEIILKNKGKLSADFYIDASGFNSVLFKHMGSKWIDKSDWMPLDKGIFNQIPTNFIKQPVCTTSEATEHGWILQVPVQKRWGTGYLYCSRFTNDDEAFAKFSIWTKKTHDRELPTNARFIKFKSGYWQDQWVGNCLVTGLASNFAEPLEATNIHQTIIQLEKFFNIYTFNHTNYNRKIYNEFQNNDIENIYTYLRFCYTTGRTDSKFWRYMTTNVPEKIKDLEEQAKYGFKANSFNGDGMFNYLNFNCVANGLGKMDKNAIAKNLNDVCATEFATENSKQLKEIKNNINKRVYDHKQVIDYILKN
jgi:tryptophan halogenase